MPGRVRKPKDKPSVENTVGNIATAVIARLRNTVFTSFQALRDAVAAALEDYNAEPFQKRAGSRRLCFESEERGQLRPLPAVPYEIAHWFYGRKVKPNCHVSHAKNHYSVSHLHVGDEVDLRVTQTTLEVYKGGERLATHPLFPPYVTNQYSTVDSHMPAKHGYQDWDAGRIRAWAGRVGPNCAAVVERVFQSVRFEEQGYDACLAVLRLTNKYKAQRVEAACRMALDSGVRSPRYAHVKPILETNQDKIAAAAEADAQCRQPATCAAPTTTEATSMNVDTQTKAKLREMGAAELVRSLEAQDDSVCMGMAFADRLQAAVDEAYSQFVTDKVSGLTKRAKLRYPEADIRKLELVEERKLNRVLVAELASCGFMERCDNLVLMGFSGTGKTYFACALGKEACRQRMRTLYIRVPDLEELRRAQVEKEGSDTKLVRKLANYQVLILDEWLLTKPEGDFRNFLLEVMERRYKEGSTMFGTQYQRKDWYARLGSDVTAEAIMDRIVHNATWMEVGDINMRERLSGRKDG